MEKTPINPVNVFWQSPEVRQHLTNAGRELACALLTGFSQLRESAVVQDLPAQYPYLLSAFQTVQTALGQWMGDDTSCAAASAETANHESVRTPHRTSRTSARRPRTTKKPRTSRKG